ncbi:Hypothetical predicted protein [Lecanosticta acicola]|uniref:SnoaL-like domain-containing protein n=1 Tax=Lecanosticta acicola TaxID=111012 RepID=A0AAI8W199_9PEZI|nr:Hypothetical predicted protein [Lecanosticta acicola]
MQKATETLISGFNTGTINDIMAHRSAACTQRILPKTLGRTPKNNAEAREHVTHVYDLLHDWTFTADNILYDVAARKSCFHATSSATSPVGPFGNEYSFFLWFSEDGEEITRIEEMVDSAYSKEYFARLTAHMKGVDDGEGAGSIMRRD